MVSLHSIALQFVEITATFSYVRKSPNVNLSSTNTNFLTFTFWLELSRGVLQKPSCKKFGFRSSFSYNDWGRRQFERSKRGPIYQVRMLTFYIWCVHFLLCKLVFNTWSPMCTKLGISIIYFLRPFIAYDDYGGRQADSFNIQYDKNWTQLCGCIVSFYALSFIK